MMSPFRTYASARESVNLLGVRFDPVNIGLVVSTLRRWMAEEKGRARYVCVSGVHGVMEAQRDAAFKRILNRSDLNVPDGMPAVWIGRAAGFSDMHRVFGPSLMLEVAKSSAARGARHFFYGGKEGVAEELAGVLSHRFPGTVVCGTYCPPFTPLSNSEKAEIIHLINRASPDVLWVGLSTPKQERWMAEFAHVLNVRVMIGVGAAFDYNTGRLRQAPRWMQDMALEWVFRIFQEPKRLLGRYARNNPMFLALALAQWLRLRKFPVP
jgi:N-acetylglucosaminyldiphosphoundecaprenol N-acetyl-beta-D-mannosaminyltransferase